MCFLPLSDRGGLQISSIIKRLVTTPFLSGREPQRIAVFSSSRAGGRAGAYLPRPGYCPPGPPWPLFHLPRRAGAHSPRPSRRRRYCPSRQAAASSPARLSRVFGKNIRLSSYLANPCLHTGVLSLVLAKTSASAHIW